jgi:hypothetical protein
MKVFLFTLTSQIQCSASSAISYDTHNSGVHIT